MSHPHMELSSSTHQVRGVQRKQYHLRRVVRHRPNLCLSSLCLSPVEVIVSTGCWRATEHSRQASSPMHAVHTRCAKARFALQPLWASLPSFWSFITFASSPQRTSSRLQHTPDRYRLQALGRARRVYDRGRLRQPPPPVVDRLRRSSGLLGNAMQHWAVVATQCSTAPFVSCWLIGAGITREPPWD